MQGVAKDSGRWHEMGRLVYSRIVYHLFLIYESLINQIMINLQSEYIEKYQFELSSKYDREDDFDVTLRYIVAYRKLR